MAYDYDTSDPSYYGLLKVYASENKKYQTEAEKMLWLHLRGNKLGPHFRRQHIIGCYIADFVCLKKKIIIEVDGGYHSQYAQAIKDYYRTEKLESLGFKVLRFRNEDIFSNVVFVLDQIFNAIARPS